ncbi:MAG: hypothetical protein MR346_11555 [Clostridium sp.]|nr:hypothetical protein [Clostridium sp.]
MAIKLTERDIEIFKIISKTGSISRGMLEEDFNMERRSIYRLTKGADPYLKIHNTPTKNGKKIVNRYTYSFATKGAEFAVNNNFCKYIQGFNGYEHSLQAERTIKQLLDDGISVDKILNEKEQEHEFRKEIKKMKDEDMVKHRKQSSFAVVDFAYYDSDNKLNLIEIETKNYRPGLKRQHSNYAKNLGGKYTVIRYKK